MNCPKCGTHISPFNLKPNCSNCGVNILIYSQEKSLEEDAKRTELEFASARIILAKVKAAFIGGGLQIARIVVLVLCVAALLVPFARVDIATPAFSAEMSLSGLGVYKMVTDGMLTALPGFIGSTLFGGVMLRAVISLGLMVALVLCDVALVAAELLSFINIKKASKAMCVISIISVAMCALFAVSALFTAGAAKDIAYISFKLGFGALVAAVLYIVNFIISLKLSRTEIKLKLRPYDLERKEILKKIRKGEMTFDELSLPVFETDEEREARFKELEEMLKAEGEEH